MQRDNLTPQLFIKKALAYGLAAFSVTIADVRADAKAGPGDLTLWYQNPAATNKWMTHALPIGNGSFGGMLFGGVDSETVQVNVDSLWIGDGNVRGNYQNLGEFQVD